MHIGGLHIFAGLFYLLLSMLLVCGYLLIPCLLLPILQRLVVLVKRDERTDDYPWPMLWFLTPAKRGTFVAVLGMIVLFMGGIYGYQRLTWMGSDNAHYQAKEYYVAGQPLAALRQGVCEVLNPDHLLLVPMNALQRLIYGQGTAYLPKNDGEIGVWEDMWFHYPYVKRMHNPYGTSHRRASLPMRQLLDDIYASVEIMATHPFADKEMERVHALRNMPRAVLYYSLNNGYYADEKIGSYWPLLHDAEFVRKKKNLNRWMVELRQRWIDAGLYRQIKAATPKIELTRQLLVIHFSSDLLTASLYPKEFTCQHPLIAEFLEARRDFTDPKADDYVWGRLHKQQPKQAEMLYSMAIDAESVSFTKYMLNHYCALEVSGEERFYGRPNPAFAKALLVSTLKSGFHTEIELLEEGFNGH